VGLGNSEVGVVKEGMGVENLKCEEKTKVKTSRGQRRKMVKFGSGGDKGTITEGASGPRWEFTTGSG